MGGRGGRKVRVKSKQPKDGGCRTGERARLEAAWSSLQACDPSWPSEWQPQTRKSLS